MSLQISNTIINDNSPLFFIAGPCVIEDDVMVLEVASELKRLSEELNVLMIFKASYDKANRTSVNSYRGPGIEKGLKILDKVKVGTGLPILSDIHTTEEINKSKEILDVLQIPAFLCRQTDLILSAALTKKSVNVKKGQFLSPWDMNCPFFTFTLFLVKAADKIRSVCLHRKAGICKTSSISLDLFISSVVCMSDNIGNPVPTLTLSRIFKPFSMPGPL